MRFSVVINTYNRAHSLPTTLDALKAQTHDDFEVVVVNGPSTDATAELLAQRAEDLRVVDCPERILAVSRNLGIDAAAGDVVAFVDDDGIPEPRWLEDLNRAYEDGGDAVGGAGGLTLDQTGTRPQYEYSVCSRVGDTLFDYRPPLDRFNHPDADPFVYLQGTNCSFRRDVLEQVQGFDENIEYIYDESELASRVIDAGYRLEALAGAVVHHHLLPSPVRALKGSRVSVTDPFVPTKNRTYFAFRVGQDHRTTANIIEASGRFMHAEKAWVRDLARQGLFSRAELEFWLKRFDLGFEAGMELALSGPGRTRPIAPKQPEQFKRYPTLRPSDGGRRLCVAFVTLDYPPRPLGGIARFTRDLAIGFAAEGHEAHVVTRDDTEPYTMNFEEGVWVHRFPVAGRFVPGVDGHPIEGNLDHVAAVHNAVERLAERAPLDVVSGSLWIGEGLLTAQDPRWVTTVACNTPMRKIAELQPETAAAPVTPWQIRIEDAILRSPAHLQPVSEENARLVREIVGDVPMRVIWHGTQDLRDQYPRTRDDGAVEVLFVGRLEPRKGIDTLLEAARAVLPSRPGARIRILGGDNPHANGRENAWPEWVAEHAPDLADRLIFEGQVPDERLYEAFADADVFCGPSRYESFGLVHVEAMMMGLPVIGCRAGGMQETVVDGETGILFEPGDADGLADALGRLIDDAQLREGMGAAGRARYEAEFRNERAVERNVAFYRELVERHRVPENADRIAHARTRDLVAELCDADAEVAEAAAEALLDGGRFPVDYENAVRNILDASHRDFVVGLYDLLLGRAPETDALAVYVSRLEGGLDRIELVRRVAESIEAGGRGVDPGFVDRLPTVPHVDAVRGVRGAWLLDDGAFEDALHDLLAGPGGRRSSAGSRDELLHALIARADVRRRVARAETLGSVDRRTLPDLVAELERLSQEPDDVFLDGVYRALLGRPVDPEGAEAWLGVLASGGSRGTLVREVAKSGEAAGRGMPADVAAGLADRVPALQARGGTRAKLKRAAVKVRDVVATSDGDDLREELDRAQQEIARLRAEVEASAGAVPAPDDATATHSKDRLQV